MSVTKRRPNRQTGEWKNIGLRTITPFSKGCAALCGDQSRQRPLPIKLGRNTITDPDELKRELARIRRQGFSESYSEFDLGVGSVAAPIFDHKGRIIASISAAGPADRIIENKQKLIELVMETAWAISLELGYGKDQNRYPT